MRVPATTARTAVVLFVLLAAALAWTALAFRTVPIRWDPSIGNACRAVDPGTMDELRRAATVPLALAMLCSAGLSVLVAAAARRDRVGGTIQVALAVTLSAGAGGVLLAWAYGIGSVFEVAGFLVVAAVALLLVGVALAAARLGRDSWQGLGRPFWLAVAQIFVVPAIVMALTYTHEIPIC